MIDNINISSSSSPAKKRKANDGSAASTDGAHDVSTGNTNDGGGFLSSWFGYFSGRSDVASSGSPSNENLLHQTLSKMDKMEEIMRRMEEKLATVGSVESKCEQLEKKCSSLENMLESTKKLIDEKFHSLNIDLDQKCVSLADRLEAKVDAVHKRADKALKHHEFNDMILKNQSWEYSVHVPSEYDFIQRGYTEDEAEYLAMNADKIKGYTVGFRRGEFDSCLSDGKGIYLEMDDLIPPFSYEVNKLLLPHWREFAAALKQFTPAINLLPDNCDSIFSFYFVQLNHDAMHLVKNALMGKPFKKLAFSNNNNGGGARGGMSVDSILDVVESNEHLRKLEIVRNQIGSQHIERLCSAVRNRHLVQLDLYNSFEAGTGDEMLATLLTIDDLTLEKLNMSSNNITSTMSTLLADFLARNPRLNELGLCENHLNDSDAELIANALRSNTTLRELVLEDNNITDAGREAFRSVLCDESCLNAAADSNHTCSVYAGYSQLDLVSYNSPSDMKKNRARKIYALLSSRNKTMSNVQHFSAIDLKLLPNILQLVQKYSNDMPSFRHDPKVDLSIVYEIMRKWDKAFPLYKSLGVENVENL